MTNELSDEALRARGLRRPTPTEFDQDYLARHLAIDKAEQEGTHSPAEIKAARDDLARFVGYPRPIERDPRPGRLVNAEVVLAALHNMQEALHQNGLLPSTRILNAKRHVDSLIQTIENQARSL